MVVYVHITDSEAVSRTIWSVILKREAGALNARLRSKFNFEKGAIELLEIRIIYILADWIK